MVRIYWSFNVMILCTFSVCVASEGMEEKILLRPFVEKIARVTSIPRSAWKALIFFVLKNPFRYAVAGYGVFNCVNGGVIKKTGALKSKCLKQKYS